MALTRIQKLSLVGLALSIYAVYVENAKQADPDYVALCDLSAYIPWISCSKVFASKYGHILSYIGVVEKGSQLDQPNALLGCVYYFAAFLSDILRFVPYRRQLMFAGALFTSALAFYLGYLLIFVLGDFCIVCASTYVVNFLTLHAAWLKLPGKKKAKTG
mmetsp:Transcript_19121/g.67537  ORF Transcript_19121/g.67537 Transcript_19121/m.67537 type:complete len:160 (-) Transcript_19121:117-596(-)